MPDITIDWVAILIAVVVSMALGGIWYAPFLFGKTWMSLIGKTQEDLKSGAAFGYLIAVLGAFLVALIMTYVVQWADATTFAEGMATGAVIWLGFTATSILLNGVFEQRPWGLIMINSGQFLLQYMLTGGIIASMLS